MKMILLTQIFCEVDDYCKEFESRFPKHLLACPKEIIPSWNDAALHLINE